MSVFYQILVDCSRSFCDGEEGGKGLPIFQFIDSRLLLKCLEFEEFHGIPTISGNNFPSYLSGWFGKPQLLIDNNRFFSSDSPYYHIVSHNLWPASLHTHTHTLWLFFLKLSPQNTLSNTFQIIINSITCHAYNDL